EPLRLDRDLHVLRSPRPGGEARLRRAAGPERPTPARRQRRDPLPHELGRGVRRLPEPARRGRAGDPGRLVPHRRRRAARRRRRPLAPRPRRRHDRVRRREHPPARGRGHLGVASGRGRGLRGRRSRRPQGAARRGLRRRGAGGDRRGAGRALPRVAVPRAVQAPTRVPLRGRAPDESVREDPPPPAARGRPGVTGYDGFRVERDERGVATATLDVPGKLNRVSMRARSELAAVFEELGADGAIRAVVLTGAGETFTAGGDIPAFLQASPEELSRLAWNVAAPERCPKPVVAKLRGYAFGVGLELALACDFRIAGDDVELALPEVRLGMIPGSGGTQRLVRLIGLGRAKDVVMRGRRIEADEALRLAVAKRVLDEAYETPLSAGLQLEGLAYGFLRTTEDFREGVEAFVERRPPR